MFTTQVRDVMENFKVEISDRQSRMNSLHVAVILLQALLMKNQKLHRRENVVAIACSGGSRVEELAQRSSG
jgi:hypothetical protein